MDAQVPGFGIRVTDTGLKAFVLRTRYPGGTSPTRREIGNCADMSITVGQGIDPAAEEERARQEGRG
jgi:hypothetical protein